ncbi:MAG TPA: hypothetical protein VIL45_02270 [Thermoplasmata archaeon]
MRTIAESKEPEPTEPRKRNLAPIALGLGVAALVLSATVLGLYLSASSAPLAPTPETRNIRIVIWAVEPHNTSMAMMPEELHLYSPGTIVVNRGDTIVLTVVNMDEHRHGFEIHGMNVASDNTIDIAPGDEWTMTFVADRAGVFQWECNVPYVPSDGLMEQECGEDHDDMSGYLIVQ